MRKEGLEAQRIYQRQKKQKAVKNVFDRFCKWIKE